MKGKLILLIFFFLMTKQQCVGEFNIELSKIFQRNYKNAISSDSGALISSKLINSFVYGNEGSLLRDPIYNTHVLYTQCWLGISINILLMQKYYLNTLKIWFWDQGSLHNEGARFYKIRIYTKLGSKETIIYESNLAIGLQTIKFPEQFVEEFNVQGQIISKLNIILECTKCRREQSQILKSNYTYNQGLHIIKAEAYYKFN